MANDLSFSQLLKRHFKSASDDAASSVIRKTRIDARTLGYPDEHDPSSVMWHGMSPVRENEGNDLWRLVIVKETPNKYLSQISDNERLVTVKNTDDEAMSFEKAMERLAIWELARMMKGNSPTQMQQRNDIGRHYFRDLALRRGYLLSSTGDIVPFSDIFPTESGKFLKSDLEALEKYRAELSGSDKLDQLMSSQEPFYVAAEAATDANDNSIQEDLESFGEIALFEKMQFFSEILVEYSKVQLRYIEEFYAHPDRFADHFEARKSLADQLNNHAFYFNRDLIDRINHTRSQLAETLFKFFHVSEHDWDQTINFQSPTMKKQFMVNPDAKETHDNMTREIAYPLDRKDVDQILFIAARTLDFCREMLKDSPQKETLARQGLYKAEDIKDLLNFLDLLDVKYMYTELAEGAIALPHTNRYRELKAQNEGFKARVGYLIANLKDSADWSPAQEAQIEDFIKAKSDVYLLDRVRVLPEKLRATHQYVADLILPKPHQLSFDLHVAETTAADRYKRAAPTRKTATSEEKKPKGGFWNKLGF